MTATNARTGMLAAGVALVVVGVLVAAGLWYAAGERYDDAVRGLARAPVGCDTTLDFATGGTFVLFVETTGTIGDVAGDCDVPASYDTVSDDLPAVALTLWDPNSLELDPDDALELERNAGLSYDAAGFVGQSIRSVEIETPGDHVLRVESDSSDFVIAVGRDPDDGVGTLRAGSIIAALVGLIGGGMLLVIGARRRPAAVPPGPAWPVGDSPGWVTTPPTSPPLATPPADPPQGVPGELPAWESVMGPPSAPLPSAPPVRDDGSTGDGERSPWAPPTDPPQ